jgi:hypothetical protein
VQQHGHSGEVLGRPQEKWRSVSVGVGIDVRAFVGTSVVVARRSACRRLLTVDFGTPSYEFTVNICTYLIF